VKERAEPLLHELHNLIEKLLHGGDLRCPNANEFAFIPVGPSARLAATRGKNWRQCRNNGSP
jgi:hypothetical protein